MHRAGGALTFESGGVKTTLFTGAREGHAQGEFRIEDGTQVLTTHRDAAVLIKRDKDGARELFYAPSSGETRLYYQKDSGPKMEATVKADGSTSVQPR